MSKIWHSQTKQVEFQASYNLSTVKTASNALAAYYKSQESLNQAQSKTIR